MAHVSIGLMMTIINCHLLWKVTVCVLSIRLKKIHQVEQTLVKDHSFNMVALNQLVSNLVYALCYEKLELRMCMTARMIQMIIYPGQSSKYIVHYRFGQYMDLYHTILMDLYYKVVYQ